MSDSFEQFVEAASGQFSRSCFRPRYRVAWLTGEPQSGKSILARRLCDRHHWRYLDYTLTSGYFDQLATRVPPPALRFLPMMANGCSAERLAAAQSFFTAPAHSFPGADKTLERVSDNVHTCISLREREGDRVTAFMRSFAIN